MKKIVFLGIIFFSVFVAASAVYNLKTVIDPWVDVAISRNISHSTQIEEGLIKNTFYIANASRNPDVDGPEDLCCNGGDYAGHPTGGAETVEVFSSSINDTAAGTGARTLRIYYLDEEKNCFDSNGEWLTEDFTLNGTTAVTGTNLVSRVIYAEVLTAGASGYNEGDITVRHSSTTTNIFIAFLAQQSNSQISAFTVCNGYKAYLEQLSANMLDSDALKANRAVIGFMIRKEGGPWLQKRPFLISTESSQSFRKIRGVEIPEKTDIKLRALLIDNANGDITANYRLRLVKQ